MFLDLSLIATELFFRQISAFKQQIKSLEKSMKAKVNNLTILRITNLHKSEMSACLVSVNISRL